MTEEIEFILDSTKESMIGSIAHLEKEFLNIRAGKATPQMLGSVFVDYYGAQTPLSQISNVNVPDARTITVQPYEKSMLHPIEKAIMIANIGFNPMNNGDVIIINVPALTEERRKELVKRCNGEGEHAKVSIRNIRRDAIEDIKKLQKDGLSEDAAKDAEAEAQTMTDKHILLIEKHLVAKEKEIMVV